MKKRDYGRVGVLMGGPSSEREISLNSGRAVLKALEGLGIETVAVDIVTADPEENKRLLAGHGIGCAFIALHGSFGEDGRVQLLLEELGLPYTGSGPSAHRRAFDKSAARSLFSEHGLRVPEGVVIGREETGAARERTAALGLPLVIKPSDQGSSIGLSIIDDYGMLEEALARALTCGQSALAERYVKGRELTVGVLSEDALPVIEVLPKKRFFDFEAKYSPGMTDYVVPARIPEETARAAGRAALAAHKSLGCSGFSRTDMILSGEKELFVLEVNTIPGLTATSLLPKAARTAGIEFPELCLRLLETAYEKEKA